MPQVSKALLPVYASRAEDALLAREQAELDDALESATGSDGDVSQLAIALIYMWSLGTLSPGLPQAGIAPLPPKHLEQRLRHLKKSEREDKKKD